MFCVLAEPLVVEREDLVKIYKKGAIVFLQSVLEQPGVVKVYGEADYDDQIDISDCMYEILSDEHIDCNRNQNFEIVNIEPAKKTDIDSHGKYVFEMQNFMTDCMGKIKREYERHEKVFGAKPHTVQLYYSLSDDRRCVTYYGSSCEGYSVKRLKNRAKKDIISISYEEFLNRKANIEREMKEEMSTDSESSKSQEGLHSNDRSRGEYPWDNNREPVLRKSIRKWLRNTPFRRFYAYMAMRVKGQNELMKVVTGVYTYLNCIAQGRPTDSNMLLAAPSGCGKTETFRALRDYFSKAIPQLPVYQIDMTSITEEGFKGANTKDIVVPLFLCQQPEGIGLVFLDEFDKKLIPSYASGGNNVNAAIQAQILTLLEGRKIQISPDGPGIDTSNTMFIGLGSFDVCRQNRSEDVHCLGFRAVEEAVPDHYQDITREEMLSLGASYELIGRFSSIVNYHRLSDEIVNQIIDRNVGRIERNIGYKVQITQEKREELIKQANGKFGCRLLYNDIHDQVLNAYGELLMENVSQSECVLTLDADGITNLEIVDDREEMYEAE